MEATSSNAGYLQRAKDVASAAVGVKRDGPYPEPKGKEGQMAFGCTSNCKKEDCPYWDTLRWDLANSYYWSGNIAYDYLFFVCQWHPWVGILFCHPDHPWSRAERIAMLILQIGISFVPAATISNSLAANDDNAPTAAVKGLVGGTSTLAFITLPNIILGVILYQMSIIDTRPGVKGFCLACCTCVKNAIFCAAFATAALGSVIGYGILSASHDADKSMSELLSEAAVVLWDGMSFSAMLWFPIWMFLPCQLGFLSLWCDEKKQKEEERQALVGDAQE